MTMAIFADKVPPEITSARSALRAARDDAFPLRSDRRAQLAGYLVLLAVGCCVGAGLVVVGVLRANDTVLWRGALTALSILSGFMVATMIFTGRIEAAKSLNLNELREVAAKSNYLLLYQIATLANHLICIPLMLLTPVVAAAHQGAGNAFAVASFGLLCVSLARSLLIPVQILELHRFTHAALLREKRDEARDVSGI